MTRIKTPDGEYLAIDVQCEGVEFRYLLPADFPKVEVVKKRLEILAATTARAIDVLLEAAYEGKDEPPKPERRVH